MRGFGEPLAARHPPASRIAVSRSLSASVAGMPSFASGQGGIIIYGVAADGRIHRLRSVDFDG
jgi:hypothetical protein